MRKVSAVDIQKLLERANAKCEPILAEQLLEFMQFPEGLAPQNCVGIQYIENEYGTSKGGKQIEPCIFDLTVHPKNKQPIFTTLKRGEKLIVSGGATGSETQLGTNPEFKFSTTSDNVLGFTQSGKLAAVLWNENRNQVLLYLGDHVFNHEEIRNPTLLSDDSVIFSKYDLGARALIVYRQKFDEQEASEVARLEDCRLGIRNIIKYDVAPSGEIYTVIETQPPRFIGDNVIQVLGEKRTRAFSADVIDIISIGRKTYFVKEVSEGTIVVDDLGQSIGSQLYRISLGHNEYKRWLTNVGCWAWVGATTRDNRECWIMGDERGPAFDKVSPLFLDQIGNIAYYTYYGFVASRRQIYKMRLNKTMR